MKTQLTPFGEHRPKTRTVFLFCGGTGRAAAHDTRRNGSYPGERSRYLRKPKAAELSPLRMGFYGNLQIKQIFCLTFDRSHIANNPILYFKEIFIPWPTHCLKNVKSTRKGITVLPIDKTRLLRATDRIDSIRHRHSHT